MQKMPGCDGNELNPQVIETNHLGRLLAYEPQTGQVRTLLDSLYMPNGIALSPEEDFIMMSETSIGHIVR